MQPTFLRMTMVIVLGTVLMTGGCAGSEPVPSGKPLFERLGGRTAIEAIVDQFVANVANDTRINGRFATTDFQKLKGSLVDQFCVATGGLCTYAGREMRAVHRGMKITNDEFGAFIENLVNALDRFNVSAREQGELLRLLDAMKKEIVE